MSRFLSVAVLGALLTCASGCQVYSNITEGPYRMGETVMPYGCESKEIQESVIAFAMKRSLKVLLTPEFYFLGFGFCFGSKSISKAAFMNDVLKHCDINGDMMITEKEIETARKLEEMLQCED